MGKYTEKYTEKCHGLRVEQGRSVNTQVREELLPVYQQAATKTGVRLQIVGREGDKCVFGNQHRQEDSPFARRVKISPGSVAINLSRDGNEPLSDFWLEFEARKNEISNARIG